MIEGPELVTLSEISAKHSRTGTRNLFGRRAPAAWRQLGPIAEL
jgi:hypothetical protein